MSLFHEASHLSGCAGFDQAAPSQNQSRSSDSFSEVPDSGRTRVAFRLHGSLRFSELFLIPIIGRAQDVPLCDPLRWTWIGQPLADALDRWIDSRTARSVFGRLYPYDWISSWTPEALQAHVMSIVPGRRPGIMTFHSESLDLPADAPRLAFICMVVTAKRGWPQLPAQGEDRFRKVLALALQCQGEPSPAVLSPGAPEEAVLDGLLRWLHELGQWTPITGWSASPTSAGADVVKITLTLGRRAPPVQFAVRMHQVGSEGVGHLLGLLAETAPMLEQPDALS